MAALVYALCALAAFGCAVLLFRGFARSRARLLLWGGLCFAALTVANMLVFVDIVIVPQIDLYTWRNLAALVGLAVFIYGLVWDTR